MGDPLCFRLTGIVVNQDDLPYWCADVLHWLAMVKSIQEAGGNLGNTYRGLLAQVLETGAPQPYTNTKTGRTRLMAGPAAVYAVYQSFCLRVEAEANRG